MLEARFAVSAGTISRDLVRTDRSVIGTSLCMLSYCAFFTTGTLGKISSD